MNTITKRLVSEIRHLSNSEKVLWQESYVKHGTKAYGVGIPDIRKIVKQTEKEYRVSDLSEETQIALLDDLMRHTHTEPKLAAILYMQLFWRQGLANRTLDVISNWFDQHWIFDWNICDWLCVRVLSPLIDEDPVTTIPFLKDWHTDSYLWKARAALVPFAQCTTIEEHKELVYSMSSALIKREERFCKTAVGWVLRQYSKIDNDFVVQFIDKYERFITKEVEKNATKYFR